MFQSKTRLQNTASRPTCFFVLHTADKQYKENSSIKVLMAVAHRNKYGYIGNEKYTYAQTHSSGSKNVEIQVVSLSVVGSKKRGKSVLRSLTMRATMQKQFMPHLNGPYHTLQVQRKACKTLWVTTILMLFIPRV